MNAVSIARNMRLFYVTEDFEGQVEILDPWLGVEDSILVELDPNGDNEGLSARVRSVKYGWERVVPHADLHLMKSATYREWSADDEARGYSTGPL